MKTTKIIFAAMAAFATLSCVQEQELDNNGMMTFNVLSEQTKSVIVKDNDGHHSILWSAGDKIQVYNDVKATGDEFTLTSGAGTSSASFTGPETAGATAFYAAYPVVAGSSCANGAFAGLKVPAVQYAVAGTYAADAYVSVAKADAQNNLRFRNACALLKVTVEAASVKEIVIEDKDGQAALAGTFTATLSDSDLTVGEVTEAASSVKLLPAAGSETFAPGVYYVSCLPESLSGVKLSYTTAEGTQVKTGAAIELTRNMVLALPAITDGAAPEVEKPSNCYIVKPGEAVSFTKKYDGIVAVELAWQDTKDMVKSLNVANGKVTVETNAVAGNALVLGKDADGKTLWSWHVWAVDFDPEATAVTIDGVTFMDRNLGALSAVVGDVAAIGTAYQWGRKDPFPRPIDKVTKGVSKFAFYDIEGNERVCDYNSASYAYWKLSSSPAEDMAATIENPEMFYARNSKSNAWWKSIQPEEAKDYWGGVSGVKTEYDPCPQGWRVPIVKNDVNPYAFILTDAAVIDNENKGLLYTSGDISLWFPCTGERARTTGLCARSGYDGNYWMGTFEKIETTTKNEYELYRLMQFNLQQSEKTLNYDDRNRPAFVATGGGVRCVKE